MTTMRVFAGNMAKLAANIKANAPKLQRAVALAIDQTVVLATPVKTGRARANWQIGLGEAPTTEVPTPANADSAGQDAIHTFTEELNGHSPGQNIHITNNLPYITPLNEGHSKQAPAGFIELAILDGQEAVRAARITE